VFGFVQNEVLKTLKTLKKSSPLFFSFPKILKYSSCAPEFPEKKGKKRNKCLKNNKERESLDKRNFRKEGKKHENILKE